MNDIVAALRDLLEPDPAPDPRLVAVDASAARPFTWSPMTLYVYPVTVTEARIESGPTARQDFELEAVLVGPDAGEEPHRQRSASVSDVLDERREAYLAAVRAAGHRATWAVLRARVANGPATLQNRGLTFRVSGYRIVG